METGETHKKVGCNGGLLHPPQRDNGNYADRRTDYVPRGLHYAPEGCRRPEVEASRGGIMQPEGHIICPEGGIISIGPRRGCSNHIIVWAIMPQGCNEKQYCFYTP